MIHIMTITGSTYNVLVKYSTEMQENDLTISTGATFLNLVILIEMTSTTVTSPDKLVFLRSIKITALKGDNNVKFNVL